MEMVMEVAGVEQSELAPALARLSAAAAALEQAAERMAGLTLEGATGVESAREAELEQQLRAAEATIASLQAERRAERRTEPCGAASMMAREGRAPDAGALDAALRGLSPEQRIAVKSELMRTGLLG